MSNLLSLFSGSRERLSGKRNFASLLFSRDRVRQPADVWMKLFLFSFEFSTYRFPPFHSLTNARKVTSWNDDLVIRQKIVLWTSASYLSRTDK